MKFLGVTSLLTLTTGVAASEYVCETSDASPYLHHVQQLIDGLNEKKSEATCLDYSLGSSDCGPTIRDYSGKDGGAAWQLCKGENREGDPLRCYFDPGGAPCAACSPAILMGTVAANFEELKNKCQAEDSNGDVRVGGTVKLSSGNENTGGGEIRLYSMPG
ncbi:hypothetical protein FALBO_14478 [Fusarium albosuccineum]|uniref:Ecp2 effector protein domain-containing protein n=1 Tax=Fusarium albosuccineum TaxID=1237068 RepID=A0A8H4P661_9HYPO|nr:hypothetical protein FALBO_14478 [Fusarium albosuccineum]